MSPETIYEPIPHSEPVFTLCPSVHERYENAIEPHMKPFPFPSPLWTAPGPFLSTRPNTWYCSDQSYPHLVQSRCG
jgi:hypothetical protein